MSRPPRLYVGTVGLAGGAAAAVCAMLLPSTGHRWGAFVVLALLASGAALVPIRWIRDEGVQGFTLEGGVFIALLFTGPVGLAPAVMVAASLAAHAVRSRDVLKTLFNAGRTGLETAAGATVFWLVAPVDPTPADAWSVLALVAAGIAFETVSIAAMAELFHRMAGIGRRQALGDVGRLSALTSGVNTVYGLVLASVAIISPWVTAVSGMLMVGFYVGFRGYAAAVVDRRRAESLNTVTHALLDVPAGAVSVTTVLEELVSVFGAARGELVCRIHHRWWRWTFDADGRAACTELAGLPRDGEVGAAVARGRGARTTAPRPDGRPEDVLSAPVGRHGEPTGAVVLAGRHGLEAWDDADASLLASVANELAVTLDNVSLFEQVEAERARLEAETTKLNDILTAASDGIVSVLADGTIEAWNPGMARITGVPAEVAIGQPWHAVLRLKDANGAELAPTGDHVVSQVLAGAAVDGALSLQVLRSDGVWRWLQCTASPVRHPDGAHRGVVTVARDVTGERELEELKGDFIATVSHELRTPLTPLKGFLSTLRNPRSDLSDDQVESIHRAMGSQLTRLETLIADLLAVAELDHGHFDLRPEPVDVSTMVEDAVQVEAADEVLRCSVTVAPGISAIADPVALVRILRSLVSNALKHTTGPVDVRLEAGDGLVSITVADEGPGIASWDQERVFNRFERLGNHLTRTQGPGLGLTIARALARRMGGDVTLSSDIGTGATFTLVLPQARPRPVRLQAVSQG